MLTTKGALCFRLEICMLKSQYPYAFNLEVIASKAESASYVHKCLSNNAK